MSSAGEVLALIPARGGSKGIPRKNVIPLAGRPVIAWSIGHAQESRHVTRVVVSTDDDEIAEVARAWGAEVPFRRPAEYAGDLAPDIDVMRHALAYLDDHEGYRPDLVVHLRPTGPVRRVADVDAAIERLAARPDADALRSVSLAHQTPYKMWRLGDDDTMTPVLELPGVRDCQSRPRQLLPPVYWQNGYVDVFRPRAVLAQDSMWGETVLAFVVESRLFDLDYPEDVPPVEDALRRLQAGDDVFGPGGSRHSV